MVKVTDVDIAAYKAIFGFADSELDTCGDDRKALEVLARHRIAGAKAALKKAARWVQDNYPHDKRVIVPAIRNIDPEECE